MDNGCGVHSSLPGRRYAGRDRWPKTARDKISLVIATGEDAKTVDWHWVPDESPLKFHAPAKPGNYELRYLQGGESLLAKQPIEVTAAQ